MSSKTEWERDVEVVEQIVLEADARIVDAFKNIGYSLEAAIADLVDNSIDAGATIVLIRFLRTDDEILSMVVVDNGIGMASREIDTAMRFGGKRAYRPGDLGMYGMGLKSASLSQADSVTVLSRSKGKSPVGRRWTDAQAKAGWKCDKTSEDFAESQLDRNWGSGLSLKQHGTVVRWDEVRDFLKATGRVDSYLKRVRLAIINHLGLQLHRHITSGQVRIVLDSENVRARQSAIATEVPALDPFSYDRTGAKGYPQEFTVEIPGAGILAMTAHIWPARSKLPGYKLGGGAVARRQGFYFYRNDRLIQAGGWNNYRDDAEPHLSLARVAVDLPSEMEGSFSVRFSKSGVDASRSFVDSLDDARARNGTTFAKYIERAIGAYREQSEPKVRPVIPPGAGIRAEVQRAIRANLPTIPKDDDLEVKWERLDPSEFFAMDVKTRTLTLNSHYRKAVLGHRRSSGADAPLVKTLLYLLFNESFQMQHASAVENMRLAAYQEILVAAARCEDR